MRLESFLYKKLKNKKVECLTCNHFCKLEENKRGICGVRENIEGKLYFLLFGRAIATHVDPIEKKPLFHFLPGSKTFSFATAGCNFRCLNCQNWDISQATKDSRLTCEEIEEMGFDLSPQEIVRFAKDNECQSIAYTYTEPTIFLEYAYDTMKLAKKGGIKNVWVSNGYMSEETLKLITPYLDAINIDLKFFDNRKYLKYCGAKLDPILANLKYLKKKKVWVEVTTLIIPTLNDKEKELRDIAEFIKKELGKDTPWHVSAFSPELSWQMQDFPETSEKTIKKAYKIGKDVGLDYVYSGNMPGLELEDTFCPQCGRKVIDRMGYRVKVLMEGKKCGCGKRIKMVNF